MSWTDQDCDVLRKGWAEGLSASQIAAELGRKYTRNAVIGKVHRLGLTARNKPAIAGPQRAPRPRPTRVHAFNGGGRQKPIAAVLALFASEQIYSNSIAARVAHDDAIPIAQRRRAVVDLKLEDCRWPVGDPGHVDFFFCGAVTLKGLPYCAGHARVAYQPARRDYRTYRG